jgi:hypothetical protein
VHSCTLNTFFNIQTKFTSLFLTRVSISSFLHVSACYVHNLLAQNHILSPVCYILGDRRGISFKLNFDVVLCSPINFVHTKTCTLRTHITFYFVDVSISSVSITHNDCIVHFN